MGKRHDDLVEKAKEAINAVFSDQSVDRGTTRSSLEDISGEIDVCLEALDTDDGDD